MALLAGSWISSVSAQGPTPATLVFKLRDNDGRALKKVAVDVRLRSQSQLPRSSLVSGSVTTDDNGALVIENIRSGGYTVELAARGFEDYFVDQPLLEVPGGITTIEVTLDDAEQVPFVRLEEKMITAFVRRCKVGDSPKLGYQVFVDAPSWQALWNEKGLTAPQIDFKKHRIAAVIAERFEPNLTRNIRRITYNSRKNRTLVRLDSVEPGDAHLTVFSCRADFVLVPAGPGDMIFR